MSKRKPTNNEPFDISKILNAPVRAVENGQQKKMPVYEAEIRQHFKKALNNKNVISMKYLFEQAEKLGVLARPKEGRKSGVVVIPKELPDKYQDEIFGWRPKIDQRDPWSRIAGIIAKGFNERDEKQKDISDDK